MTWKWNTIPLLRYLLAFCAGIVLQIFVPGFLFETISIFCCAVIITTLFTYYRKFSTQYKLRWIFGVAITIAFVATGSMVTFFKTQKNYPNHFTKYSNGPCIFIAQLDEPLSEKISSYKTVVKVTGVYRDSTFYSSSGLLLIYFEKDSTLAKLNYGDELIFTAIPQDIPGARNPGEFNYKRFLYFHQIYKQAYLKKENLQITHNNSGNFIFKFGYKFRDKLVALLKENIPDQRQYAVAEALTVGYEDDLDQELIQAYASSGALHVLSVSGMHVGLIYIGLLWMLSWTNKIQNAHHFKYFLLLLLIWFYSLITGLSPSVMRSAAMLSLMIFAKWINRNSSVFNTLAASAFGLLILNPYYITEVGFQLSYAAVFGIVFLHPMIYRWLEPKDWLSFQIWTITSVSIAAQTMTMPLGLLYFHQFPNLFIISNLIVIPLSTIVIFGCILLLVTSWIPYCALLFGKLVWGVIWLINYTVMQVDAWHYSLINGISISIFETWIMYLLLGFVIFFLVSKKAFHLQGTMVCFIVLLMFQVQETYVINHQKKIIVYSVKNQTAINFIDGKNNIFIADSVLRYNRSSMLFHITHNWWDLGVHDAEPRTPYASITLDSRSNNYLRNENFISFSNRNILLIDSTCSFNPLQPIHFNLAIISKNALENLKHLSSYFTFDELIIDSSNNYKVVRKIKMYCVKNKIPFYDVSEKGAFILDI